LISRAPWAILAALVPRTLAIAALSLALAFALGGCATPCEDLGSRICSCQPAGSERDACERAARAAVTGIDRADAATQELCDQRLDTCTAPGGLEFCDWLLTCPGKVGCGLAEAQTCP
jgi:hypothetical protein